MVYDVSYKTLTVTKPLRIRFDEVDGLIRVYGVTRYLVSFGPEIYDAINNRNRYLINQKSGITHVFSHSYARIKIDSYNSTSYS